MWLKGLVQVHASTLAGILNGPVGLLEFNKEYLELELAIVIIPAVTLREPNIAMENASFRVDSPGFP